ncbi:PQQ-binding-like beta-propeller repeat protein [bacterium]|nr:PQQ-binding-like beta-propeller repeat protein [bacterium]
MIKERPDPHELNERLDPAVAFSDALEDNYVEEEVQPSEQLAFHSLRVWQTVLLVAIMAAMVVAVVYFAMRPPVVVEGQPAAQGTVEPGVVDAAAVQQQVIDKHHADKAAAAAARAELYLWRYHIGGKLGGLSLGPDGRCYVQGVDGNMLFCVDEGEMQWSYGIGNWSLKQREPLANGDLAIRTSNAVVYIDGESGQRLWEVPSLAGVKAGDRLAPTAGPFDDGNGNVLFVLEGSREQEREGWPGSMETVRQTDLVCMDRAGKELWRTAIDGIPGSGLTTAADGTCFVASRASRRDAEHGLACIAADGKLRWQRGISDPDVNEFDKLLLGPGNVLYAICSRNGSHGCSLFALDAGNGRELWREDGSRYSIDAASERDILLPAGDSIYLFGYTSGSLSGEPELLRLNSRTGERIWGITIDNGPSGELSVGPDGRIYVISHYLLQCISPEGSVLWQYKRSGNYFDQVEFGPDGQVFVRSQGHLAAFNRDGHELYRIPDMKQDIVVTGDGTFYTTEDEELVALRP